MEDSSVLSKCTRNELSEIAGRLRLAVGGRKSEIETRIWEYYQQTQDPAYVRKIVDKMIAKSPKHGRRPRVIEQEVVTTPARSDLTKEVLTTQRSPQNVRRTKLLPVSKLLPETDDVGEDESAEEQDTVAEQTPTRRRSLLSQQLLESWKSSPKTERLLLKLREQYSSVSAIIQSLVVCELIVLALTTVKWDIKSTGPVLFYLSGTIHEFHGPVPDFSLFARFDTFWYPLIGWLIGFVILPALPALVVHIGQTSIQTRRGSRRISSASAREGAFSLFQCGDYSVNVITWSAARLACIYILRGISPHVAQWPYAVYAHLSQELLVVTGTAGLLFTMVEMLSKQS
ncbi:hypothetical protein BDF19DRAFT_429556 [Syncephalis fuscata]|nr:hypothetical protein BDF19DRAFT_429556 [Syncephalis fuscata]